MPASHLRVRVTSAETFPAVGATFTGTGVHYRVWAPDHPIVGVHIEAGGGTGPRYLPLAAEGDGYYGAWDPVGRPGDLYQYELGDKRRPDPASRHQPRGVEGPSEVVAPAVYGWRARNWQRTDVHGRVIYELHVGTFTEEGTFLAAIERLDALVELGINTLELMPLADFAGDRNWGYDGVMLFAPARCYGRPDDLRALVDAAHTRGLSVVLDVVYNHLGPSGNVLPDYAAGYFHTKNASIWGQGLDYDRAAVRRFFLQNVCMWLDEYRIDGLRLDAVHAIKDTAPRHLVAEIAAAAHARGAWVVAEDERNLASMITPAGEGGWGVDALWADDFHHTLRVALTAQQEAHFRSYTGSLDEWVQTLGHGWLYHGQYCPHWDKPRGTPAAHLPPERFVVCLSNHDQAGNRPLGDRLHDVVTPAAYRAASMLLCLSPYTPMLFMGQEWAASTPFPFFTDLPGDIGANMRQNRLNEFTHYGANYTDEVLARMPDPQDEATFTSAKINWREREEAGHAGVRALYRECLRLRAHEDLFQNPARDRWAVGRIDANVLGLRWSDPDGDWLLLLSFAEEALIIGQAEALLATRKGCGWTLELASNEVRFGGEASADTWRSDAHGFYLRAPGAVVLRETRLF